MLRHPAVAGQFYKGSAESLRKQIQGFTVPSISTVKAVGILSPHAGFMYSGAVAGAVYSRIEIPQTIVLIGPNHTGLGESVSLMSRGQWETPLGTVCIDEVFASSLLSASRLIREDSLAHLREHSLEVQLPFIQHFRPDVKIVPIQMMDVRLSTCQDVGRAIAATIRDRRSAIGSPATGSGEVLIVASSDMSHYERAETAKDKDFKAIQRILELDSDGLYYAVRDHGITMCGYGPAVAMLTASKMLGATKAELVKYTNSGDVSGDYEQVVGYAGIIVM